MRYTSFLGQGVMIGAICMTGLLSACGDKEPATQNICQYRQNQHQNHQGGSQ